MGLNYKEHASESSSSVPSTPVIFGKWSTSLIPSGAPIQIPAEVSAADWEAELAVVIDRDCRDVPIDQALEVVRGYLCFNDISARDIQELDGQWTRGKSFDTFGPIGPTLVPASEVPDPGALSIRCLLNGDLVQDGTTADLIFSIPELIAFTSRRTTLLAGDVIATGTPNGVGYFRDPPITLEDGDQITVEIESIGTLTNPVVRIKD